MLHKPEEVKILYISRASKLGSIIHFYDKSDKYIKIAKKFSSFFHCNADVEHPKLSEETEKILSSVELCE
jgi:hypothetical protein